MTVGPYRITSELSSEGDNIISIAKDSRSDTVVVVKRPKSLRDIQTTTEADILLDLKHHCIISLRDIVPTPTGLALIFPYYPFGDLFWHIVGGLTEAKAKIVASQMLHALAFLKSRGIVHRDIKPENILLESPVSYNAVLADFGLAAVLPEEGTLTNPTGTLGYAAPEMRMGSKYTEKVDIWSLGATLFASVTGRYVSAALEPSQALEEIAMVVGGLSEDPDLAHTSTDFRDFLKSMLRIDPNQRVSAEEALEHKWFEPTEEVDHHDLGSLI
jgi:serine/threonine protein kinase